MIGVLQPNTSESHRYLQAYRKCLMSMKCFNNLTKDHFISFSVLESFLLRLCYDCQDFFATVNLKVLTDLCAPPDIAATKFSSKITQSPNAPASHF